MSGNGSPAEHDRFFEDPPLTTSEEIAALAPEWAALHASIPGAHPFAHPDWTATWLRHLATGARPVYIAARQEETLIGVFPLVFEDGVARFAGDPDVCDFAPVLVRPGEEEIACAGLVEWLMEDMTPALDALGIPAESPLRPAFESAADRFGWPYAETREALSPRVALPGDWHTYLANLPKKHRHELRRKLRNLEEAGPVALESATGPGEISPLLEQLLAMMRTSHDGKGTFLTAEREAFFRDLAATFAERGMARLVSMTLDGRPVATVFAFETGTTTYLYNSGYDPEYASLAVGLVSKALLLRDAQERGKQWFDCLRGDERYKFHLGCEEREVLWLELGIRG